MDAATRKMISDLGERYNHGEATMLGMFRDANRDMKQLVAYLRMIHADPVDATVESIISWGYRFPRSIVRAALEEANNDAGGAVDILERLEYHKRDGIRDNDLEGAKLWLAQKLKEREEADLASSDSGSFGSRVPPDVKEMICEMKRQLEEEAENKRKVEESMNALQRNMRVQEEELRATQAEKARAKKEVQHLREDVAALQEAVANDEHLASELRAKQDELAHKNALLKEVEEREEKAAARAKAENDALHAEIRLLKEGNKENLKKQKEEIARLRAEIEDARKEKADTAELEERCKRFQDAYEEAQRRADAEEENARNALIEAERRRDAIIKDPFTVSVDEKGHVTVSYDIQCPTPAHKDDYIALYVSDRDDAYDGKFKAEEKLVIGPARKGEHTFKKVCVPGFYDIRFFNRDYTTNTYQSAPFCVGPEVKMNIRREDRVFVVTFEGNEEGIVKPGDRVGFFKHETRSNRENHAFYKFVILGEDLVSKFDVPRVAGDYDIRFFHKDSWYGNVGGTLLAAVTFDTGKMWNYVYSARSDVIVVENEDMFAQVVVSEDKVCGKFVCHSIEPHPRNTICIYDRKSGKCVKFERVGSFFAKWEQQEEGEFSIAYPEGVTMPDEDGHPGWELRFMSGWTTIFACPLK